MTKNRKSLTAADLFCGAGGTSAGLVDACDEIGLNVELTAINHWDVAVATHTANHPTARHLCASLDALNPRDLFKEGELNLLWASPECTHHSVARGGKPVKDQSRATAWCVVRWAEALRPNIILVENVKEFRSWGPLMRKRVPTPPSPVRNGRGAGGEGKSKTTLEWLPDPKRKGEIFRSWIANLEAIGYRVDYQILCAADYGDPTTRERLFIMAVRRGSRYKICWPQPTHAPTAHTDLVSTRKAWVPARDIIDWTHKGSSIFDRKKPLADNTLRRIMIGLERFGLGALIMGQQSDAAARTASQPVPTVSTAGAIGLTESCLVEVNHGKDGKKSDRHRARSIKKPLGAITTSPGTGLCEFVLQTDQTGGNGACVRSKDRPLPTVVTKANLAVVEGTLKPFIIPQFASQGARDVKRPLNTITTQSRGVGLAQPKLSKISNRKSSNHPTIQPSTLIQPHVVKFYGSGISKPVSDTLDAVTTKERFGLVEFLIRQAKTGGRPLVEINGVTYELEILFRMLQWRELASAQGFKPDYEFTGNTEAKVKQIGNAVPRRLARSIVRAVLTQNPDVS